MKISIVVPAFNEEKLIADSLTAMRRSSSAFAEKGWEVELVVCDNNSTDRTADLARSQGAKVVFEPVNQIARARNCGAAGATGDWLVFVDADSHPSPALFTDVAEQIESGKCLAGGCTVQLDEAHLLASLITGVWNRISRTARWAAGSFIFCEAPAFREIGGFNTELFASEEIDLSRRLKQLAKKRGKKMVVLHRHPLVTSARKIHLYSKGEHLKFMLKAFFRPRATVRNRGECTPWYDGRR